MTRIRGKQRVERPVRRPWLEDLRAVLVNKSEENILLSVERRTAEDQLTVLACCVRRWWWWKVFLVTGQCDVGEPVGEPVGPYPLRVGGQEVILDKGELALITPVVLRVYILPTRVEYSNTGSTMARVSPLRELNAWFIIPRHIY